MILSGRLLLNLDTILLYDCKKWPVCKKNATQMTHGIDMRMFDTDAQRAKLVFSKLGAVRSDGGHVESCTLVSESVLILFSHPFEQLARKAQA